MTLAEQLVKLATVKGVMIATAESCTGGLLAGAITDVPGSSSVFDRGWVTYSNEAKGAMLGVDYDLINRHGAVSEQVAAEMAANAFTFSNAGLTVSVTGVAGPGRSDHKPEGRVCFGVSTARGTETSTVEFGAIGRARVRQAAVDHALGLLLSALHTSPAKHA